VVSDDVQVNRFWWLLLNRSVIEQCFSWEWVLLRWMAAGPDLATAHTFHQRLILMCFQVPIL